MDEYEYEFRPANMGPSTPWSPITLEVAQFLLNDGSFEVRQRPVGHWKYYLPGAVLQ